VPVPVGFALLSVGSAPSCHPCAALPAPGWPQAAEEQSQRQFNSVDPFSGLTCTWKPFSPASACAKPPVPEPLRWKPVEVLVVLGGLRWQQRGWGELYL